MYGCGNNTDHRLVAATCSLRLKRCSLPQDISPPIAVEKLLDPTTQRNFVLKLHNRFALLSESGDSALSIENLWKEGRNALKETSHAVLGLRRRKKHQWISDETLGTNPPIWQQGPGTTTCYQTQTTTTRRHRLVQPHSRRGRRRESHWKQCSALPYHPHTHRSDCIQATTCDSQGRITLTGWTASKLPPVTAKDGSHSQVGLHPSYHL